MNPKTVTCSNWNGKEHEHTYPTILKPGDIYVPWYFIKGMGDCPKTINELSLLYGIREGIRTPKDIASTSFTVDIWDKKRKDYLTPSLLHSLAREGQQKPIIVMRHDFLLTDQKPAVIQDPEWKYLHCLEGHHRLVCCDELNHAVKTKEYYFLTFPYDGNNGTWNLDPIYNSIYFDNYWSHYQTPENRRPWFTIQEQDDRSRSYKYPQLMRCLDFIKDNGIKFNKGMDYGCAEGLYTFLASSYLGIPMYGKDSEPGRIVRAMLYAQSRKISGVRFLVDSWDNYGDEDSECDFFMALSIVHHMDDQEGFIRQLGTRFNGGIIELRVRERDEVVTAPGSIKGYRTRPWYYEQLQNAFRHVKFLAELQDRKFYVVWN